MKMDHSLSLRKSTVNSCWLAGRSSSPRVGNGAAYLDSIVTSGENVAEKIRNDLNVKTESFDFSETANHLC